MDPRIETLLERCRAIGRPLTEQRRIVLEILVARGDHPTADDVYLELRQRMSRVSRTTIYRNLEALVAMRLVRRVCHPGAACRYDALTERHHHLVCDGCGSIVDLADDRVPEIPTPDTGPTGFRIDGYSVHFHGRCDDCAAAMPPTGDAGGSR